MRYITTLSAFVLLLAACGNGAADETTSTSADETQSGATTMAEETESEAAGTVTIGDQTWEFAATMQCRVMSDQVSVSGTAAEDPDVEIVFDVFGEGDYNLSVIGPEIEWTAGRAGGGTVEEVSIDGTSVSGTATVSDVMSGETADATFEFNC